VLRSEFKLFDPIIKTIFRSARTSCTTFDCCARPSLRENCFSSFSSFSISFFSSFSAVTPGQCCHPGDPLPRHWGCCCYCCWCCCCKWSSGVADLLWTIMWICRLLANDHPKAPASCKWSSWVVGVWQMIIPSGWPLANDHLEGPASCKWSSVTQVTLVFSARIQIQSRGPF